MCIRDRITRAPALAQAASIVASPQIRRMGTLGGNVMLDTRCLLYTSDAADERSSVDLGGRRIIKKKNDLYIRWHHF